MPLPFSFLITAVVILVGVTVFVGAFLIMRAIYRRATALESSFDLVVFRILVPKHRPEDERSTTGIDQVREEIARMEAFFTTIGGLRAQHGLRAWFRGRSDLLSFEIVALRGEVMFMVAVPRAWQSFVEEQLTAQFHDAYIETIDDYNMFAPRGVVLATTVGMKRPGYFPLKTYKKIEADPLDALTNAMSKIRANEGAAIQFVVRSARKGWRRGGVRIASAMQQGQSLNEALSGQSFLGGLQKFIASATKSKKRKDDEKTKPEKPYQLSPMEQELVKGLEEKAAKFGLDANIRIVASAENAERTGQILDSITQAFAQYNIPQYGNMLRVGKPTTRPVLLRRFIYRWFEEGRRVVFNTEEMASMWHLPLPSTETPTITWLTARRAPPPVTLPAEGLILGEATYRGHTVTVRMKDEDRRRHAYIIGGTGTGKSTMMENMAIQDIRAGRGVAIIDPHGTFVEHVLPCIPKERADDVVIFDPSDVERPVGLNMLEASTPEAVDFAIQEMIAIFYKLVTDPSMIGPMFEHYMRNAMLALMSDPDHPGTLVEIPRILTDPAFQKLKLKTVTDPIVRAFWEKELPQTSGQTKGEMLPYLVSKIGRFIENAMVRNIVGQEHSGFDFREVMDQGKILLVNLSKGKVGEMNAKLLGLICVTKLQMAALARADAPETARRDFYLYIDEFQNFVTDSIAIILAEARKYRLNLIMAHQYVAQLVQNNDTSVRDAIFGNVGTVMCFRVGVDDAETLATQLGPPVTEFDVMNIEARNAYLRLMVENTAQRPFNFHTRAPIVGDARVADALVQLSRLKYGRDRMLVEEEIIERSKLA